MWNPFRAVAPARMPDSFLMPGPIPVSEAERSDAHKIATLEAQLFAQTRELGRLRAEDALKVTVIADLRAKLDRFTSPKKRDARGRYLPTTSAGETADV